MSNFSLEDLQGEFTVEYISISKHKLYSLSESGIVMVVLDVGVLCCRLLSIMCKRWRRFG